VKSKKTQSQIGRMSRSKGADYENQIAKILSLWWTKGRDNKSFRRTPMSGGWDHRHAAGDLIAPDPNFPVHIEIRKRETFELGQLLKGGDIMTWLREGESKCPAGQDLWYIMSRNRDKDYLFMRPGTYASVTYGADRMPDHALPLHIGGSCDWIVTLLSEFLDSVTPDNFRQAFDMEVVQRIKHRGTK
jgi:hypothetical protein